jgi:isoquinoline 1-oxidoreductase beta subunit
VARVDADRVQLWGGFQQPDYSRNLAAQLTGVPVERVRVNVVFGGGGFGRRWELDSTEQVVRVAKTMPGRAVKLIWTREQDLQHDFYRGAYMARYRAAVDSSGKLLAVHGRIAGQSILGYKRMPAPFPGLPDPSSVGGLLFDEYAIPRRLTEYAEVSLPVPIGFWRSVSASQNVFFAESIMDELAHASKRDPFEYRRELLAGRTRTLNVLELAARESGWGKPLPKGHGRGIAVSSGFGGVCVEVIEVSVKGNRVAIERVTAAYDCGPIIDPGVVEAQIQGGIVWGLSAAINGESTIAAGAMQQTNFHQQPMLSIVGTPKVDVHLVKSEGRIGGVGEAGVPPAAPALANAIFAATGKRVRTLPMIKAGFEFAG